MAKSVSKQATALLLLSSLFIVHGLCGKLNHFGVVHDVDGEEVELYSASMTDSSEAIYRFHESFNATEEAEIEKRDGGWDYCVSWEGQEVGGGGACHKRHAFQKYFEKFGAEQTRITIRDLLDEAFGKKPVAIMQRNRCAVEEAARLCVSWAEVDHPSTLSEEAMDKLTRYAMICIEHYRYSSMFKVDDSKDNWIWVCISDRPKGCRTTICKDGTLDPRFGLWRPDIDEAPQLDYSKPGDGDLQGELVSKNGNADDDR